MIPLETFYIKAAQAVTMQKGLCRGVPVDPQGNVDAIGAYGYCYDRTCQEAVDALVAARGSYSSELTSLQAAACERAFEVILGDVLVSTLRKLIDYNDGLSFLPDDRDFGPEETPQARKARVLAALQSGQLPEKPRSEPLEEAA